VGLHQPFMVGEAFALNDEVLRHVRIKISISNNII